MAINKVVYSGDTLIDITDTTATADKIVQGYFDYGADGTKQNGTLVINKYYTGSTEPSASFGNDGDIYFKS